MRCRRWRFCEHGTKDHHLPIGKEYGRQSGRKLPGRQPSRPKPSTQGADRGYVGACQWHRIAGVPTSATRFSRSAFEFRPAHITGWLVQLHADQAVIDRAQDRTACFRQIKVEGPSHVVGASPRERLPPKAEASASDRSGSAPECRARARCAPHCAAGAAPSSERLHTAGRSPPEAAPDL